MLKLKKPLVVFDLETTGIDVDEDRIVEISLIKLFPDKISNQQASTRINPDMSIPEEATAVHGITDDDVKDKPFFKDVADKLHGFIRDCDIAGFNSNSFDVPFLNNEFLRAGVYWDLSEVNLIDVGNLFKIQEPRTLVAAARFYLNEDLTDAHSAAADTEATRKVLEAMFERYDELPDDIEELAVYSNYGKKRLGVSGHFAYNDDNDEIVFNFGKHKGEPVTAHLDYVNWMKSKGFPPDTKDIINKILEGEI